MSESNEREMLADVLEVRYPHVAARGAFDSSCGTCVRIRVEALRVADAVLAAGFRLAAIQREAMEALAVDFDERVDWSSGRGNYGDNEAYEGCARDLRALAAADGTPS